MEIVIKLTNVGIVRNGGFTEKQLHAHILDVVGDALMGEPFGEHSWIQRFTLEVDIKGGSDGARSGQ